MTTVYTTHLRYPEHNIRGHPERPDRIYEVWRVLENAGFLQRMEPRTAKAITDAQILSVHTPDYLDTLKNIEALYQSGDHQTVYPLDHDTYLLTVSPLIARLAAGGTTAAIDAVLSGSAHNGLAAVRPPGHHAMPRCGMGFCILNNVAIAARHAQNTYGLDRILIVDYDVHHGNGTEAMFYDDPSVLFISTHQAPFYPGTGALNDIGEGPGIGYTVNIPLAHGNGDQNYARIFQEIVWPIARRYRPQLILVSAGFDAHWVDPLADMQLSLTGLARITRELVEMANVLCDGRIVFVMEGGYDVQALGHGMRNIAHALLGEEEISDPLGAKPAREPEINDLIEKLTKLHTL